MNTDSGQSNPDLFLHEGREVNEGPTKPIYLSRKNIEIDHPSVSLFLSAFIRVIRGEFLHRFASLRGSTLPGFWNFSAEVAEDAGSPDIRFNPGDPW